MTHDATQTQGYEVGYDDSGNVQIIEGQSRADMSDADVQATALGGGCTAGAATMAAAARQAGQSDLLDQYARDYPKGPHDQPQSMCPAFGNWAIFRRCRPACLASLR